MRLGMGRQGSAEDAAKEWCSEMNDESKKCVKKLD